MKLEDARELYYSHSGLASESARQLAFAGIAVVWILATQERIVAQPSLRGPLFAFITALALDLLQYYSLAAFWGAFSRLKERAGQEQFDGAPPWGNWLGILCFWTKGAAVAVGYFFLAKLLWAVLFLKPPSP